MPSWAGGGARRLIPGQAVGAVAVCDSLRGSGRRGPMVSRRSSSWGRKTRRKWSGWGQLKPVPWHQQYLFPPAAVRDEGLIVLDRINLGIEPREHVQRGLGLDAGDARNGVEQFVGPSRWRRMRPPSATRSSMLW